MRVSLSPETIESLEDLTSKRITRNGDEIIRQVIEMVENSEKSNSIKMTVCDNTKKEMGADA